MSESLIERPAIVREASIDQLVGSLELKVDQSVRNLLPPEIDTWSVVWELHDRARTNVLDIVPIERGLLNIMRETPLLTHDFPEAAAILFQAIGEEGIIPGETYTVKSSPSVQPILEELPHYFGNEADPNEIWEFGRVLMNRIALISADGGDLLRRHLFQIARENRSFTKDALFNLAFIFKDLGKQEVRWQAEMESRLLGSIPIDLLPTT